MSPQQLVALLSSRGLKISDTASAEETLQNTNYYRLSGYLHDFKQASSDQYVKGLTWEKLLRIYDFDRRFTRILMFALEDIEETLKTRLSLTLTTAYPKDPEIYLRPNVYRAYAPYMKFLTFFEKEVDNNRKLPFVRHHNEQYGGHFPMWVAVELFTMGNVHALYENLEGKYQKALSAFYGTGPRQLSSWIENLTYTRNHLAHYMRIYNFNFGRTPLKCRRHLKYAGKSNMIFDQIYTIACMYSDANEWNNYVLIEIEQLLTEFEPEVSLSGLGFPEDWRTILRIDK